jgi:hypothetical protein
MSGTLKNITGEPKPAHYVPCAAIFAGNQDHIGPDVSPIAASTPVRSSLGDAHVSMSDPEIRLAQQECKAIKAKMPTGAC